MYCEYCGAELKEGQLFCPKCGAKIEITEKKTNNKKTSKSKKIIALVCCVAVLITGIVGGLYFKNKKSSTGESTGNYVAIEDGFADIEVTDEKTALEAINSVADVIGIKDIDTELKLIYSQSVDNTTYYRFQQYYDDIPVFSKNISLAVNKANIASALVSNYENKSISLKYAISEEDAKSLLMDKYSVTNDEIISYGKRIFENEGTYMFYLPLKASNQTAINGLAFVSGNGKNIRTISTTYYADTIEFNNKLNGQKDEQFFDTYYDNTNYYLTDTIRKIYGYETESDNYWLIFSKVKDAKPISWNKSEILNSPSAVDAVANVKKAYDYYAKEHNYISPNGKSSCTVSVVDGFGFSNDKNFVYDNANSQSYTDEEENSYTQINIGKKTISEKYTMSAYLDVIAHEYTHAVVNYTAALGGNKTSESLNEAYSDIMGEVIENYVTNNNDWIIGNDIRNINKTKLNSFTKYSDKKDAHENAQIIDYVAYLMNNGCNGSNESLSMKTIGTLWFNSLFVLPSNATFEQCRNAVELAARIMLNNKKLTTNQYKCVQEAFDNVGIDKASYTYKSTVKNEFDLKVLNSKGNNDLTFSYNIYDFSDNGKRFSLFLDIVKKDYEDFKIDEGTLTKGQKHLTLSDGLYLIELNGTATNGQTEPIFVKIIVDGNNPNSEKEVLIRTDFDEVVTVVLNEEETVSNETAYKKYAKLYQEKTNQLGEIKTDADPRYDLLKGVCFADLIDFNNDGLDEFVIMYYDSEKPSVQFGVKYFYEVWGYQGGNPILLDSGKPFSSNGGVCTAIITEKDGQKYLVTGATDAFDYYYFNGFDGDEFKCVLSCEAEYGEQETYMLNGEQSTAEKVQSIREQWLENSEQYGLTTWPYENRFQKLIKKMQNTKKALNLDSEKIDNSKTIEGTEVTVCGTLALPRNDYENEFNSTENTYYQLDLSNNCVFSVSGVNVTTDKIKLCSINESFSFSAEMQGLNVRVKGILELQPDANVDQQAVIRVESIEFIL